MSTQRKTPQTWINAGLKALPKTGPDALRAETLARTLDTTKGSFYWHFKDVPAFQAALLADWQTRSQSRISETLASADTTVTALRALAGLRQTPLDRAVRAWATYDAQARKTVAKLDKFTLAALSELLAAIDATHPDFPGLIHAAMIAAPAKGSHAETLVDLLLVLK